MIVRDATERDLDAIVTIYNHAIADRATAHTTPLTLQERRDWFATHDPAATPLLVCGSDVVHGWASLSAYRPGRAAVSRTLEISYYVHRDHRRRGVGARLMDAAMDRAHAIGIRALFAILFDDNVASIGLLERFGFRRWGHLPRIARFDDGSVRGHFYYGRHLDEA